MTKRTIVLVFVMFGLPVVIATLMHSQWLDWQPKMTRNHGTLIQPVIEWDVARVADESGNEITKERLAGRWQLVYHTRSTCDEACMETLYWLRQVRLAQDRHVPEVGLLFVSEPAVSDETIALVNELSAGYVIASGAEARSLSDWFPTATDSGAAYIMDPMANIIMSYDPGQPADDIRKDLGRLLTWTKTQ